MPFDLIIRICLYFAVTKKQVPEAVERIEEPSKARKRSTTTTTTETGPSKKPKPSVVVEKAEVGFQRKRSQPPVRIETNIPEDIPSDNPSAKERQKKKQEKKEKKEKKEKRKEEKRGSEGQPKEKKKKSKSSSDPSEANLGVPSVSNEQKEPTPQAETQEDTILSDATPDPPSNVPQQDTVQEEIISNKASGDTPKDSEATISEKIMPEPNQDQPEHPDSNEPQDKTFPFQEWGKTAPVEVEIEEAIAATTQESIRKAAKDGISHFSAAAVIKEEIKSLEDAIKIQSVEVGLIKDHYADFKSKCLP
ncbi:unnamed protein product [Trifolium pratense]|uniref:Uncharacterized protein n=1 Tax=Trifolium pratense TaxID=57577 RepID=A0ACB0K689_TRIPR|nr:unnamed protein product [Trifolium pratense]